MLRYTGCLLRARNRTGTPADIRADSRKMFPSARRNDASGDRTRHVSGSLVGAPYALALGFTAFPSICFY